MYKKKEKVCFICNPAAGRRDSTRKFDKLRSKTAAFWEDPEFKFTESEKELEEFARKSARSFDLVVACGGDGTINKVVNELAGSDTCFGIIPYGSGNDFASSIGMPHDIDKALRVLHNGRIRAVDLIRCEGDANTRCINTLGIGLDGWANYFSSKVQGLSGQPVYVLGVLKALWHFRGCRMTLNIDGESMEKELTMVTVCNGPEEGGGFKVAPEADNSDGYIDLLMIDKMPLLKIAWYLPKFLFKPKKELKGVKRIRCKTVAISCKEGVAVHCDGELLGTDIKNLYLNIEPARLKVVVP